MRKLTLVAIWIILGSNLTAQAEKEQRVLIQTMFGDIIVKLYNDTPLHRDNFINNVKNGWLDGTLFHRVKPQFMIQGGDPNSIGAAPDKSLGNDRCTQLPAEIRSHHFHKKGALASARLPDGINPERKSSGCQFYIVQGYKYSDAQLTGMETERFKFPDVHRAYYKAIGGVPFLDLQYTVFGEVVEGLEIIDLISAMPTGKNVKERPNTDIEMTLKLIE